METFLMSDRERGRLKVLSRVGEGAMTLVEASEVLGVSYRQVKRVWARYQAEGDRGLVHRLRGRASNRQSEAGLKERVLQLYLEKYADYGPTLAAECLAEDDGLVVAQGTLRRWLLGAGLWQRKRRRKVHRRRRQRRSACGDLVQMDGSHHDWFEGRRGKAALMVMIDDATGAIYARFFEEETLAAAWETFGRYVRRVGVPGSLYVDQASIYRSDREPTDQEIVAGEQPRTQFGRSMDELEVKLILARSPQAKGRVERMNGTLQDRLLKALRRKGISDLATANVYLEEEFLAPFNQKFSVPAADLVDRHRPLPPQTDLAGILAECEARVVQNDWTVRWRNQFLQLPQAVAEEIQPGTRVTVREQLDGVLRVFHGKIELPWSPACGERPARRRKRKRPGPTGSSQGQKPAANHPWRRMRVGIPAEAPPG